jgi:predicted amidohydrolase YtcJ
MVGIQAAVTRKGMSGAVYGIEEALTVVEALRGYTALGAWLTFDEQEKGTIEPGKLADMIVLDQNILGVDPDHIMNIRVMQTWLNGKLVYSDNAQIGSYNLFESGVDLGPVQTLPEPKKKHR